MYSNLTIARGAKNVIAAKHETAEGSVDRVWEEVYWGVRVGGGSISYPGATTSIVMGLN